MGDVLAIITREPAARLFDEPTTAPLPRTAASRRRQRARAAIIRTIPLLLFALTVLPRAWAPDLVPFGGAQAAALDEARRLPVQTTGTELLAGGAGRSALALAYPFLALFPSPAEAWVAVRAVLDGVAAVFVFLAARALAGSAAGVAAALLYGLSPWAWVLVRDVAAPSVPPLAAGGLLAGVWLVRAPRTVCGLIFGLLTGLLVRLDPAGWAFMPAFGGLLLLARPGARIAVAALVGLGLGAGPTLVSVITDLVHQQRADADAPAMLRLALDMAAGVGAERRMLGVADLPPGLASLGTVAVGVAALVLAVGLVRAGAEARHGQPGLLTPVTWAGVPPVLLALVGDRLTPDRLAADALHSSLPGLAVLAALSMANGRVAWARARPLGIALGATLAILGAASVAALMTSATTRAAAPPASPYATWAADAPPAAGADAPSPTGNDAPSPTGADAQRPAATLRFWQATADEVRDAASRTGSGGALVLAAGRPMADGVGILTALLDGTPAIRSLPSGMLLLPVDREAVYLILPGADVPPDLAWPSARLASVPLRGTGAVARVVTLRPRPVAQWLALRSGSREVQFADGTSLRGARARSEENGAFAVELIWLVPTAPPPAPTASSSAPTPLARSIEVVTSDASESTNAVRALLPERREGEAAELVVLRLAIPTSAERDGAEGIRVRLVSDTGETVPPVAATASTDGSVEVVPAR